MKFASGGWQEENEWLMGDSDKKIYKQLTEEKPKITNCHLSDSGYSIFRNGYDRQSHFAMMDCGPLAAGVFHDDSPSAAHGHADLLSTEICAYGESFLVDPGFANYRGNFERHCYFRSTAAHNTIEINGKSQAKQGNILQWSFAPHFKFLHFFDGNLLSASEAEHYGYRREQGSPVHRRIMGFVDNKFWLVFDEIVSEENVNENVFLAQHWHFNDHINLQSQPEKQQMVATGRNAQLVINMFGDVKTQTNWSLECGGEKPYQGWISPNYLALKPAPVWSLSYKTKMPWRLLSIMVPKKKKQPFSIISQKTKIELKIESMKYKINLLDNKKDVNGMFADVLIKSNNKLAAINCRDKKSRDIKHFFYENDPGEI